MYIEILHSRYLYVHMDYSVCERFDRFVSVARNYFELSFDTFIQFLYCKNFSTQVSIRLGLIFSHT